MRLAGKTVLITGGTDGIGLALAHRIKAAGSTVIVVGRHPERLASAAAAGFETIEADLSSEAGCAALLAKVTDRAIDILINNAGMGAVFDVNLPADMAEVDRAIFLNLNAPIRLIAGMLDPLRTRPEAMIVNVTSGLAIAPSARTPVYCATKAGLRSFTMALRAQLSAARVHVLEVLPPVVETRMTEGSAHKKISAGECARQIVSAMEKDRDQANVGMTGLLNMIYNVSPALARRIMLRY